MCRRCGAPLHRDGEDAPLTLPAGLARRRRSLSAVATKSPKTLTPGSKAAIAAASFGSSTPDNLLPGAMPRPDNLLPRATRSTRSTPSTPSTRSTPPRPEPMSKERLSVRTGTRVGTIVGNHWRRILVLAVVAAALATSLIAGWPVAFGGSTTPASSSATQYARATGLLRTVVGGGRTLFASQHSFAGVSPAQLSAHSYKVPVVAATKNARVGQVSMQVTNAAVLTLATPADAQRCVFARDEPRASGTRFAIVRTADCRAAAAPAKGWSTR
jgi:hypothetical protein